MAKPMGSEPVATRCLSALLLLLAACRAAAADQAAIDKQIAVHKSRKFAEQSQVIAYLQQAREILTTMRASSRSGSPRSRGGSTRRPL